MCRTALKKYTEICRVFLVVLYFLCIFKVIEISEILNENLKLENHRTSLG
jgi:hypothetical protein